MNPIQGRANTPEGKRLVMERILAAWLRNPELRLGQLIVCVSSSDPFYVEDFPLADACESKPEEW